MKKIKLFYPKQHSNFGDILSPIIFEKVLGYKVEYSPRLFAEGIPIGSLLQTFLKPRNNFKYNTICAIEKNFLPPLMVMGSGFIAPEGFNGYQEEFRRKMNFLAVRGKLSRKRVESLEQKEFPELTLGDPGLLLPMVFDPVKVPKKYKYGIISHRFDVGNPLIQKLKDTLPASNLINILDEPMNVSKNIAECEIILSTAMHGLIAADSFNIPSVWITVSDKIEGGVYKFNDYYSVFDIERSPLNLKAIELNEENILANIEQSTICPKKMHDVQEILIKTLKSS